MFAIYKREMLSTMKTLIVWVACVAGMGLACILLYSSMKDEMADMAESFSSLGAFSDAFGMSQLSIATLTGFYATEVGTIHGLGGCMFAAIIGMVMLSKEEDGHTGEFLFTLPLSRVKVISAKLLSLISVIVAFNVISVILYVLGFVALGEDISVKEFLLYHGMQMLLHIQVGAMCFALSAFMKRNKLGIGLGIVLMLYAFDMIARVVPDVKDMKMISPYSYANAAELLGNGEVYYPGFIIGIIVLIVAIVLAFYEYNKRDLAS